MKHVQLNGWEVKHPKFLIYPDRPHYFQANLMVSGCLKFTWLKWKQEKRPYRCQHEASSSWKHNKGKADLQFTLQICIKYMHWGKTACGRVNLALKNHVSIISRCTQWMKFNPTQSRDLGTRVIFSCKLQLMSRHVCRGLCQWAKHFPSLQPRSTD